MKILETIFFVLMIAEPVFFIILAILNIKKVNRNKKFRNTLIKMILLTLIINGVIWGALKITNEQHYTDNKIDDKKDSNKDQNGDTSTPEENQNSQEENNTSTNKTSKGYKIETIDGVTYVDGYMIANKTYPLPSTYVPTNTYKAVGTSTNCAECINKDAYTAYIKMKNDMSALGMSIWIASGYRSYTYQNALYNNYVNRSGKQAADTFSARAGHSEHQTGYAFDLNSVTDAFATTKEGIWVNENCYKYGFIIRYPKDKDNETGYKYESWHLRYVGEDLAAKLYNAGDWITMETYFGITSQYAE